MCRSGGKKWMNLLLNCSPYAVSPKMVRFYIAQFLDRASPSSTYTMDWMNTAETFVFPFHEHQPWMPISSTASTQLPKRIQNVWAHPIDSVWEFIFNIWLTMTTLSISNNRFRLTFLFLFFTLNSPFWMIRFDSIRMSLIENVM